MKKILLVLAYLLFAGVAHADSMSGLGYSLDIGQGYHDVSEEVFDFAGLPVYVLVEYPGYVTFYIDAYDAITIYALNGSVGDESWSFCGSDSHPGSRNFSTISCSSNQGIYSLSNAAHFYPASSTVTYGVHDFSHRTYVGGTGYPIRVVNRYLLPGAGGSQETSMIMPPSLAQILYATNNSASYAALMTPACSASGQLEVAVDNFGFGAGEAQDYFFYANFLPATVLNFTSATYDDGAIVSTPTSVPINFTVTVNHPEALTGVAWYVDGALAEDAAAPMEKSMNYSFSRLLSRRYHVEVQLEDVLCQSYKTIGWYVDVGTSANLQGIVYQNSSLSPPIAGADVTLSCSGLSLETTTTALNGSYRLTGLIGGKTYDIVVSKTGYSSATYSPTFNASYTYSHDFFLVPSGYSSGGAVLQISDLTNQTTGDFVWIWATYRNSSSDYNIDGACNFSGSGILPASGPLTDIGSEYNAYVEVTGSSSGSYTISCSDGVSFPALSASDSFTINGAGSVYSSLEWVTMSTPLAVGASGSYVVKYAGSDSVRISGASCWIDFNGSSFLMSESSPGYYSRQHSFASPGTYPVNVNCSKAGYATAWTDTGIVQVSSSTPPTTSSPHCFDGVRNYGEADIDCGGPCSPCADSKHCNINGDCISSYCLSGICRSPSCSDGIKDGYETGVDCGGGVCPSCACFVNWDCDPSGSENCDNYACRKQPCAGGCDSINWYSLSLGFYSRARYCINGSCSFYGSQNSTNGSDYSMTISGLSGMSSNVSGFPVVLGNCEEATNGFRVVSSVPTKKYYYFSTPPTLSPSVPASDMTLFFGREGFSSDSSQILPALCEIPHGSDRLYSLTTFLIQKEGGDVRMFSAYSLTFASKFRFNATYTAGGIMLNGSRDMSCRFRQSYSEEWSNVSGAGRNLFINQTDGSYTIFCNTTYNEGFKVDLGKGGMGHQIINDGVSALVLIFGSMFSVLTGSDFSWAPWLIIPVALLAVIGIPLAIVVGYFAFRRKSSGPDGK